MFIESITKAQENSAWSNPQQRIDFGGVSAAWSSAKLAVDDSFIGTAFQQAQEWGTDIGAAISGAEPMTQEEFDASEYAEDEFIKFEEGTHPEQYALRKKYQIGQMVDQRIAQDGNGLVNFAAGLVGGSIDMIAPIGIAGKAVSAAKKVKHASRAGKAAVAADRMMETSSFLKRVRAGEASFGDALFSATKFVAVEQGIENLATYGMSQNTARNYSLLDVGFDTVAGTALANMLVAPSAWKLAKTSNAIRKDLATQKAMEGFMEVGDMQSIVKAAAEFDVEYSGDLRTQIDENAGVQKILDMPYTEFKNSPDSQRALKQFFYKNETGIWLNTLKGIIPLRQDIPIYKAKIIQQLEFETIVDAIKDGKVAELPAELKQRVDQVDGAMDQMVPVKQEEGQPRSSERVVQEIEQAKANPIKSTQPKAEQAKQLELEAVRLEKKLTQAKARTRAEKIQEDILKIDAARDRAADATKPLLETTEQRITELLDFAEAAAILQKVESVEEWWTKTKEAGLTGSSYMKLAKNLKQRTEFVNKAVDTVFGVGGTGKLGAVDLAKVGEEAYVRFSQNTELVDRAMKTPAEAEADMKQWAREHEVTSVLREIANVRAQEQFDTKLVGKGEKYIRSFIKSVTDGLPRRGIRLVSGSLSSKQKAQIVQDQAAIQSVLAKHKLTDLFSGNLMELTSLPYKLQTAWEGKTGAEASEAFIQDMLLWYRSGEVPAHWKGDTKEVFTDIASTIKHTLHGQVAQLNRHGAGITLRQDHLGLAARWDKKTVRKMGEADFTKRVNEVIDWDKTAEAHGFIMSKKKDADGKIMEYEEFNKAKFIEQWYNEITSPNRAVDHWSRDLAKSFSHSRKIHIKEGLEFEVIREFSGDKSIGRLLQDQIRRRSEMISVVEFMGNKPLENFDKTLNRYGLMKDQKPRTTEESSKRAKTKEALRDVTNSVSRLRSTFRYLAGEMDDPLNTDLSEKFKDARRISHLAFLWTSTASALSDVPLAAMTLDQLGTGTNLKDLMKAMKRSATRNFEGNDEQVRAFFAGNGAARDAIMNAGARRMALFEDGDGTMLSKMSDLMFSINGLNFWTDMMQESFLDIMTSSMGTMAKSGDWDPHMKMTMESFGFTDADFKTLSESIEDINGVDRVGASSVAGKDPDLQKKMLEFLSHYMDEAVIVPDASTQALVRFGTRAGTYHGEAIRTLLQYQSFPLAINRVIHRKLMVNAQGDNPWTTGQISATRLMTYMGAMMGMAYIGSGLKDMARLREPMMPWDMGSAATVRLLALSGMAGVADGVLDTITGSPTSLVAPLVRTAGSVGAELLTGDIGGALYDGRAFMGGNIFVFGAAINAAFAHAMKDSYGQHYKMGQVFNEFNYGTEYLFDAPSNVDSGR